jgi:hypothetical protein
VIYPAALAAATAVSAAVLADEMLARRGAQVTADQVTDSCLAALDIDRRGRDGEAAARQRGLRLVPLPGCAV